MPGAGTFRPADQPLSKKTPDHEEDLVEFSCPNQVLFMIRRLPPISHFGKFDEGFLEGASAAVRFRCAVPFIISNFLGFNIKIAFNNNIVQ